MILLTPLPNDPQTFYDVAFQVCRHLCSKSVVTQWIDNHCLYPVSSFASSAVLPFPQVQATAPIFLTHRLLIVCLSLVQHLVHRHSQTLPKPTILTDRLLLQMASMAHVPRAWYGACHTKCCIELNLRLNSDLLSDPNSKPTLSLLRAFSAFPDSDLSLLRPVSCLTWSVMKAHIYTGACLFIQCLPNQLLRYSTYYR